MKILIINGPNLNLLGRREPEIYGGADFETYLAELRAELHAAFPGLTLDYFQSNIEGEIVDAIQKADGVSDGIVLNAGGYTHTSVSIADAVAAVALPVVEVHISNIMAREPFRQVSLLAPVCRGTITGFGLDGYRLGVSALLKMSEVSKK
ncbi:MAG: type II 3-dehydroquinate dehydratase [Alistipes sp.]|jgi:3-dehydroquinate dehydratase-2|nr:type II 3-dehydroquinate dehydratase [Alistipes sp.]